MIRLTFSLLQKLIAGDFIKKLICLLCAAFFGISAAAAEPISIAHRGAPDYAPENTISSFLIAEVQGADAVELDVWLTADQKLAVNHDDTAGRVWNRELKLETASMAELSALTLSHGFKAAFPQFRAERMPQFCEVISRLSGDMRIFAELKTQSRAAVDALVAELVRTGTKDRTTIICFSRDVVAYAATKGVDCAWLVCCEKPEQVLELDVPAGCALDVNCAALDENTVKALHERGVIVYCWTAAGQSEFEKMAGLQVDGITCDNLSFLKK